MEPIPLLGRAEDLGELAHAWRRLSSKNATLPAIAVITGPAGIGKTRLVAAAIEATRPANVYSGTARVHSPSPYDWLASVLAARPDSDERLEISVPADALGWLRQDISVPRERYAPDALLRIAVRLVRAMVGDGPAVLVVEDLHALDPASLNLLAALATTPLRALFLVTSRAPESAAHRDTLARLCGMSGAIRAHLGPFDADLVGQALRRAYGEPVTAATAAEVFRRTDGVPGRLAELLATRPALASFTPVGGDPDLTDRERDVLALIAAGLTNQQAASRLGISVRTVTVHVSNLLRKTRSRSRTDAAMWAVRHGVAGGSRQSAGGSRQSAGGSRQSSVTTTSS